MDVQYKSIGKRIKLRRKELNIIIAHKTKKLQSCPGYAMMGRTEKERRSEHAEY